MVIGAVQEVECALERTEERLIEEEVMRYQTVTIMSHL
jgi:hypothetical protein